MKYILRTIFPAVLLLTVLSGSALAQTKIATVDLKKLFDNYYKTKLAQAALQDHATQLDKDDNGMKDDLKKATDDYQQLLTAGKRPGRFRRRARPPQTGRRRQAETIGRAPHGH